MTGLRHGSTFEALTGFAVLAVAGLFTWYVASSSSIRPSATGYELKAEFLTAHGLAVGTQVHMAGIPIGSVTSLELDPQRLVAVLGLSIEDQYEIPVDSLLIVMQDGMLGDHFLEFRPGGSENPILPGSRIGYGRTQSAVDLATLLSEIVESSAE